MASSILSTIEMEMRFPVATVAMLLISLVAHADDADVKMQARAHFRAGTALYEAGNYDRAIDEYREAYKLLPLPDLLFNLGQAYRLKGDLKTAADHYRRYLADKPTGPVSDEAREHLAEIETASRPAPSPPAATSIPPAPETATVPASHVPQPAPPTQAPVAATVTKRSPVAPSNKRLWKRAWFWGVVGAVAAGVAVGVGVGLGEQPHPPKADGAASF